MRAAIAIGTSCCTFCSLAALLLFVGGLHVALRGRDAVDGLTIAMMPGDETRRALQAAILQAMRTQDFSEVGAALGTRHAHAALLLGDARGPVWELEVGRVRLGEEYEVASQSKIITALTVHQLMDVDTKVSAIFKEWKDDASTQPPTTVRDVLGFTTGWDAMKKKGSAPGGCAYGVGTRTSWEECVKQLAELPRPHAPGEYHLYGNWHLVLAAASALKAKGLPLSFESWVEAVQTQVFEPSGITDKPKFCATGRIPALGLTPGIHGVDMPNFASGMCMSARHLGAIQHALQFGALKQHLESFRVDATARAKGWSTGLFGNKTLGPGMWHYTQGAWLACDEESSCGASLVIHSVGIFGAYAWMDLQNGYWGVFMYDWWQNLMVMAAQALVVILSASVVAGVYGARGVPTVPPKRD